MSQAKVLIVEDEAPIREMVRFALNRVGYQVDEASDAAQARVKMSQSPPDLMLVDWMMPGESGIDFVRSLKREEHTRNIPVIMVTARVEEDDRVRGLDAGADDYICKPFSPKELLARIKALLRRSQPQLSDEPVEVEGLRLEPDSHRVSAGGKSVEMGPTEFRILHFFMTHSERVYSRAQILDYVWGSNVYIEERTVDVHIRRLRKVLAPGGHDNLIQTVRGAGYRFSATN